VIRISHHVLQRISERAGVQMTEADVLALIPEQDLARMEAGAVDYARIKRLALDVVCRDRCLTTAMHSHRWRTAGPRVDDHAWRRRDGRPAEARTQMARFDADEDLVVGGRVRRVEA
jgi:hypothetical protein